MSDTGTPFNKAVYKPGDKVKLSYEGQIFSVTVKESSIVGFFREYFVVFEDGSSKWMKDYELGYTLN